MRACGLTGACVRDLWEEVSDCKPSPQSIVFHPKYISTPPPPPLSVPCSYSEFDVVSFLCSDGRSPRPSSPH